MALPEDMDIENLDFDPAPDEELICSICFKVFMDPVYSPCQHTFCRKCIADWLYNNKSCPLCRKLVSLFSLLPVPPIMQKVIMKLTVKCENFNKGCRMKPTLETYRSHLQICGRDGRYTVSDIYKYVLCPSKDTFCCSEGLFLRKIKEQQKEINKQRSEIRELKNLVKEKEKCIESLKDDNKKLYLSWDKMTSKTNADHKAMSTTVGMNFKYQNNLFTENSDGSAS